jgi:hypothetical protein
MTPVERSTSSQRVGGCAGEEGTTGLAQGDAAASDGAVPVQLRECICAPGLRLAERGERLGAFSPVRWS